MDKCFACSNDAEYMLPCYHKICGICLNDLSNINTSNELVCLCYPDDNSYTQCLTSFKQEEIVTLSNEVYIEIDKCPIHNEDYTAICDCDRIYCDKCEDLCVDHIKYDNIEEWKKYVLLQIDEFRNKLNNKINGLKCVIELINDNDKPAVKQLEDIIDTILVYIVHIESFNQLIDNIPISTIIKRKNKLLNTIIDISNDIINSEDIPNIEYINIILDNGADIHCGSDIAHSKSYDEYVLRRASENGYLDIVKSFIKYNTVDIHYDNELILRSASRYGHLELVEYLISHNADVHAENDEALRSASSNGHLAVVELLLKH